MVKATGSQVPGKQQQGSGESDNPHSWIWIDRHTKDTGSKGCLYEATFRFVLEGVAHGSRGEGRQSHEKMRAELGGATFESVLEALYPGQRLEFVFRTWRSIENRPVFHWNIIGRTRADTLEAAKHHAEMLWESVALMLASQPNYHFRPTIRPASEEDLGWSYLLLPRTAAFRDSPGRRMGFHKEEKEKADSGPVFLPLLDPQPAGPFPLIAMLASLPIDLDLCVALEPVHLDESIREKLVKVRQSLKSGSASCKEWPSGRVLEREVIASNQSRWEGMIDYWLAHIEAIRLNVILHSGSPVSAGLLGLIGQAIHPQYSFEIDGTNAKPLKLSQPPVLDQERPSHDLRGLLHDDHALLPALFPDVKILEELDLPRAFPLPPSRLQRKGIRLGSCDGQSIRLAEADRMRHNYIVGATGSGKSTLLLNLITQDIEAGRGVCLIDPHGDLYDEVMARISIKRGREVVLFNPADFAWVTGLNFLECTTRFPDIEQSLIANEMIRIFDRLYDLRQTGGPMFEQYMRNALMLVMSSPASGGTLMDVPLLFENREYRKKLLETCTHPLVVSFWEKQAERAGGEGSLENMTPYITSKLNQFTHNPLIHRIIGQKKSTIHFRKIMDQGGILLINLSKGLLSEMDAQLLGMLLMGKLFHAALGRIEVPVRERRTFHIYVDEFQNFATATMGHMLSEARKFGLCLTLANQHLAQLRGVFVTDSLKDAVLGNVGNILLFRLGVLDAEELEKFTLPWLSKQDLEYLPDFHVVARLLSQHEPLKPFVFKTDPMPSALPGDVKTLILKLSQNRDMLPRSKVEEAIHELIRRAKGQGNW